jgi:hypothetical protein
MPINNNSQQLLYAANVRRRVVSEPVEDRCPEMAVIPMLFAALALGACLLLAGAILAMEMM